MRRFKRIRDQIRADIAAGKLVELEYQDAEEKPARRAWLPLWRVSIRPLNRLQVSV
jgi:hypothetical protein